MGDARGKGRRRSSLTAVLVAVSLLVCASAAGAAAAGSPSEAATREGAPGTAGGPGAGVVPAGASASPDPAAAVPGEELRPDVVVRRTLTVADRRLEDDSPYHAYWFEARRGQWITLAMRSDQVDPYLWLYGPGGELLARDDDSGLGPYDAAIHVPAPEDGIYRVLANTALGWQRGEYAIVLKLEDRAPHPAGGPDAGSTGGGSRPRGPDRDPPGAEGEPPDVRGLTAGAGTGRQESVIPPVEGELQQGVRRAGHLGTRDLIHFWRVVLPAGADRFEVGIFNATGPLDLVATQEEPIAPGVGDFPYKAMSGRENERLLVELPEGAPRQWLVGVVNWEPVPVSYEIELALDRPLPFYPEYKPPLPQVVAALSPLERAIQSTVQISTPEGSASGTLVTPDGLILTNYHVVGECRFTDALFGCEGDLLRGEDGEPVELIIGLPDKARGSATQYFVARALRTLPQYDLALLQVVEDLNGIPVRGPIFPWLALDLSPDAVRLGDEVMVAGYPAIAQTSGRIPISLTRGVLSGFTLHQDRRVLLQTDAAIESGHSGGALIKLPEARLVGVPSDTRIDWETFEKQNYARPVTLLPDEWLDLLEEHGATLHGRRARADGPVGSAVPGVAVEP